MKICIRVFAFIFVFQLFSFYTFAQNSCQEQDYIALRALFLFCDGNSWPDKDGWPTNWQLQSNPTMPAGTDVSTWEGVVTNEDGCVTELHFSANNMGGIIPDVFANIAHLTHLDFSGNRFIGTIPPELADLTNLTYLAIGSNLLTGGIPPELGNLTNLNVLKLQGLKIEGTIPPELGNLTNLQELTLRANCHTGTIPSEIGNLTNLRTLNLSNNHLSGTIPPEIGNLTELQTLDLSRCFFTGNIPAEIGNLTNLSYFDMEYNTELQSTIPPEMGNLTNLTYFNASGTPLIGNIPPELGNLINLEILHLGNYYTPLAHTPITPRNLTGNIPPELGNLTKLKELFITGSLTGNIPPEIGNIDSLVSLQLQHNQLTGSIPPELAELENLELLVLFDNQLSGCFDPALSVLCPQLYEAHVDTYHGSNDTLYLISDGNDFDISWQDFCATQLSTCGCQHQDYINLRDLYLNTDGDNWLNNTGWFTAAEFAANLTLPTGTDLNTWYGVTTNAEGCVTELRLSNNQLIGNIPTRLRNIENLTHLHLDGNQLSGAIPPKLANLQHLTSLRLSGNQLVGSMPMELGSLSSLTDLQLADNQLSGCYDMNLMPLCGQLTMADAPLISNGNNFDMDWGTFCYLDPIDIGQCADCREQDYIALRALYLSTHGDDWWAKRGWLTEAEFLANPTIPAGTDVSTWFGVTTNEYGCVTELYVERCSTPGTLPPEIGRMANLKKLILNDIALTDSIPPEIGALNNLEVLNLSDNTLTGNIPTELAELLNLKELVLNDNQLTNNIPAEITALSNLEILHLVSNNLTGNIPSELGDMNSLININLSNNNLTGNIPPELGDLTSLVNLSLSLNDFAGSIPLELGGLTNLTSLSLSKNNLTGNIPPELGNLNLDYFRVDDNQLSGCYDSNLLSLCNAFSGDGYWYYDPYVSDGNDFKASWFQFCKTERGVDIPVNLKVVLEGAYDPALGEMTTTLNTARGLLPGQTPANSLVTPTSAGQPYNAAPWNYTGTEGADWTDDSYTDNAVDWVLISLRTDIAKDSEKARAAGVLNKDGTISFPDRCNLSVNSDSVYIVVEHRNHMGVMTPQPVPITDYMLNYDFTQGNSYDGNATGAGQKEINFGVWGMYVGDADQASDTNSYDINGIDKSPWVDDNGSFDNYTPTDFNMNGDVNGADKIIWSDNYGTSSRVPK